MPVLLQFQVLKYSTLRVGDSVNAASGQCMALVMFPIAPASTTFRETAFGPNPAGSLALLPASRNQTLAVRVHWGQHIGTQHTNSRDGESMLRKSRSIADVDFYLVPKCSRRGFLLSAAAAGVSGTLLSQRRVSAAIVHTDNEKLLPFGNGTLPDFNVDGVGFYEEDVSLITPGGHELINPALPYKAADIEKMMARLKQSRSIHRSTCRRVLSCGSGAPIPGREECSALPL